MTELRCGRCRAILTAGAAAPCAACAAILPGHTGTIHSPVHAPSLIGMYRTLDEQDGPHLPEVPFTTNLPSAPWSGTADSLAAMRGSQQAAPAGSASTLLWREV